MATKTLCALSLVFQLMVPFSVASVCDEGPPIGVFCTDDMKGFYECARNGQHRVVQCPASTRCSCFLNQRCSTNDDGSVQPCQLYYPPKIDTVYTMLLEGQVEHSYAVGHSIEKISEVWSFDQESGKSMKKKSDGTYELIVRNVDGSFDEYKGNSNYCKKTTVAKLPNLIDLELFRFISPAIEQVNGEKKVTSKWTYIKGRRNLGQGRKVVTWLFGKEVGGKTMQPVKLSSESEGSAFYKHNVNITYYVTKYQSNVSADVFKIPDVCQQAE